MSPTKRFRVLRGALKEKRPVLPAVFFPVRKQVRSLLGVQLLVNGLSQISAGFELSYFLGSNFDGFASLRVTAGAGSTLGY